MRRSALLAVLAAGLCATPAGAANDPLRGGQWNLDMVEADAAHATSTGAGAVVAIVDTGVRADHPDLQGALLPGADLVSNDATPEDGDGHGTHLSGIVAARAGNGVGVGSVAPGASILPIRVLGNDGSGSSENVAKGIDLAVARGADIINLSLGDVLPVGQLLGGGGVVDEAIDRALDRDVIVVAASGNNGVPVCEQPSSRGRLLCVGSVDRRGNRSFFSSFGTGLGIVAPGGSALPGEGEDVLSTHTEPDYIELAGTSQAAPHVAGVAALLVARGVRGQAAVRRLLATARDAGPKGPDAEFGAGIVNARAAVAGLGAVEQKQEPDAGKTAGSPVAAGGSRSAGPPARIAVARRIRISTLLRRGLGIRCTASGAGRCTARLVRGGRTVASGSVALRAGRTATARVRPTRSGRRTLRALRRSTRAALSVRLPGAAVKQRSVVLARR